MLGYTINAPTPPSAHERTANDVYSDVASQEEWKPLDCDELYRYMDGVVLHPFVNHLIVENEGSEVPAVSGEEVARACLGMLMIMDAMGDIEKASARGIPSDILGIYMAYRDGVLSKDVERFLGQRLDGGDIGVDSIGVNIVRLATLMIGGALGPDDSRKVKRPVSPQLEERATAWERRHGQI